TVAPPAPDDPLLFEPDASGASFVPAAPTPLVAAELASPPPSGATRVLSYTLQPKTEAAANAVKRRSVMRRPSSRRKMVLLTHIRAHLSRFNRVTRPRRLGRGA